MKFIFNDHVKVLEGFYVGQTGRLRQCVEPKPKEGETPGFMYSMEFDAFPGSAIWVKEDQIELVVSDTPPAN